MHLAASVVAVPVVHVVTVVVVAVVVIDCDESLGRPTGACLVSLDRGELDGVELAVAPPGRFSLLS